jgi:phage shock protein C
MTGPGPTEAQPRDDTPHADTSRADTSRADAQPVADAQLFSDSQLFPAARPLADGPSVFGAQPLARARLPLRRSRRDRVLGGVCGGIGRYLDVDPVLLRVAAVALALSGGVGVLAYVIAWVAIPEADEVAIALGAALIGLGVLLLVRQWLPWFGAEVFWPLVVVAVGVVVLLTARR